MNIFPPFSSGQHCLQQIRHTMENTAPIMSYHNAKIKYHLDSTNLLKVRT